METLQLKHCPICNKVLPISEFGICRGRKDQRSLYCKGCIRAKRNAQRKALKEYKAAQKKRNARQVEIDKAANYDPLADAQWPVSYQYRLSPVDRVRMAIQNGARTQKEIRSETKLSKDEIGDALANLLLWSKEIRTQIVDETRMYFMNEVVKGIKKVA